MPRLIREKVKNYIKCTVVVRKVSATDRVWYSFTFSSMYPLASSSWHNSKHLKGQSKLLLMLTNV